MYDVYLTARVHAVFKCSHSKCKAPCTRIYEQHTYINPALPDLLAVSKPRLMEVCGSVRHSCVIPGGYHGMLVTMWSLETRRVNACLGRLGCHTAYIGPHSLCTHTSATYLAEPRGWVQRSSIECRTFLVSRSELQEILTMFRER